MQAIPVCSQMGKLNYSDHISQESVFLVVAVGVTLFSIVKQFGRIITKH